MLMPVLLALAAVAPAAFAIGELIDYKRNRPRGAPPAPASRSSAPSVA